MLLSVVIGDEGGVVNVLEPHPHLPYLAVSGLDNSVKVFMPVGEKLTSMSKFKKVAIVLISLVFTFW